MGDGTFLVYKLTEDETTWQAFRSFDDLITYIRETLGWIETDAPTTWNLQIEILPMTEDEWIDLLAEAGD